ncbi:uncharacterized protein [Rutidosis leptorrhynchoides]|uniref:uncharacterized protein n=1 Tax=Rutidosis leptorrhynchoides TaxID=125765 RepID=UPI003A99358A
MILKKCLKGSCGAKVYVKKAKLKLHGTQEDSLWAKWVNVVKLKGKSIWQVQMENSDTWFDKWSSIGSLDRVVNRRDKYQARLSDDLKVAQIIQNNSWIWHDEWKIKYPSLFSINVHVLQDNEDDVCWLSNDGSISRYQTSKAWVNLRENKPKVSWYHVIWFKQATPKHAFVLWLVIQNRLVTQDKLQKWYPNLQLKCVLCDLEVDSHKHLFYSCAYSSAIWGMVNRKLLFKGLPNDLQRIMVMLSGYPYSKNIWNVINRIVIAAMVYYVWQERNYRIFKGRKRSELELKGIIEQFVRFKLLTLKVKGSQAVEKAAKMWELSWVNLKFQVSNGQSLL